VLTHGDLCSINIFLHGKEETKIHLIDFEDAHIGTPSFDIGYLLSEYFVAGENFSEKKKEIYQNMQEFLDTYFLTFNKQDRNTVEVESTMHVASMMLYRTFGLSKDTFSKYIKDDIVRNSIKDYAVNMIKNSNRPISYFIS
jgi:aminoglycoside phosphotransferase (APT) family kinase protein